MKTTIGKFEVIDIDDDWTICVIPVSTIDEEIACSSSGKNDSFDIAQCFGPDRLANATLIAAIPDVMAALRLILKDGLNKDTRKKARLAIAKTKVIA